MEMRSRACCLSLCPSLWQLGHCCCGHRTSKPSSSGTIGHLVELGGSGSHRAISSVLGLHTWSWLAMGEGSQMC